MGKPEIDEKGFPKPYMDSDILPAHSLLRNINPVQWFHPDKGRITDAAFQASKPRDTEVTGMSTNWWELMQSHDLQKLDKTPAEEFCAELNVKNLMSFSSEAKIGSTPELDNPYHVDVWNLNTKSIRRRIMGSASYHIDNNNPMSLADLNNHLMKNRNRL